MSFFLPADPARDRAQREIFGAATESAKPSYTCAFVHAELVVKELIHQPELA